MLLVIVSMYRWVVEGEFDRKNEKKNKRKKLSFEEEAMLSESGNNQ